MFFVFTLPQTYQRKKNFARQLKAFYYFVVIRKRNFFSIRKSAKVFLFSLKWYKGIPDGLEGEKKKKKKVIRAHDIVSHSYWVTLRRTKKHMRALLFFFTNTYKHFVCRESRFFFVNKIFTRNRVYSQ